MAANWLIREKVAGTEPSLITAKIGDHENKSPIPETGSEPLWQIAALGEFNLSDGINAIYFGGLVR